MIKDNFNLRGLVYEYHSKKVIENAQIGIVASQIQVDEVNHKIIVDALSNDPVKVGPVFSAKVSSDGSYIIQNLPSGIFQVDADTTIGILPKIYNSNSYFVMINDYDVRLDIELAKKNKVGLLIMDKDEKDESKKKLRVHEIFFKD